MNSGVVVYDPNDENPTGAELSAALANLGYAVRWLLPEGASKISLTAPGVDARPVLAGPRPWTLRRLRRRLVGPFAFAWPMLCGRPGIAIWMHDIWDGLVLALVAIIAPQQLFFIHNNPRAIRPRPGIVAKLEQFLIRRCHVVVHTDWLRSQVIEEEPHHIHVIAHPNYTLTAQYAPPLEPVVDRVAYIGALRQDKGAQVLIDTLIAAQGDFEFWTVGQGGLTKEAVDKLGQLGISYVATGRLDQPDFLRALTRVRVVIAPYVQPTESGSVLLCLAMGVPVLALDSPTMQRILNESSRFATPADLGKGIARFLLNPWPTFRLIPDHQDKLCQADLETALACQALRRPNRALRS